MPGSLFVRAARRESVERTPVWFMRQAGRILPEYRALREKWSLIDICRQPELCAEVTLQPMRRMELDAAVLFADIMLPLIGIGVELDLVDNVGPVIRHPIRTIEQVRALRPIEPDADVPFVMETIRLLKTELGARRAVIGFSGAPFTLASYLIEGKPSREFLLTKTLMNSEPLVWHELMDRLTEIMIAYLRAKVSAGVDALQLFDSWVGCLSPNDYARHVAPYSRRIFAALAPAGVPFIHFGTNTAGLLPQMKDDGATVIGVDWRIPLDVAWKTVGYNLGIQGNLDPALLLAPWTAIQGAAEDILRRVGTRPGHIFNLGHGLLPDTPLDNARRLVDFVHERSEEIRTESGKPSGIANQEPETGETVRRDPLVASGS
ncbi:MAG: uroporphyrinogen decarboxylase [Gemmatimonadaceae bacterium]